MSLAHWLYCTIDTALGDASGAPVLLPGFPSGLAPSMPVKRACAALLLFAVGTGYGAQELISALPILAGAAYSDDSAGTKGGLRNGPAFFMGALEQLTRGAPRRGREGTAFRYGAASKWCVHRRGELRHALPSPRPAA